MNPKTIKIYLWVLACLALAEVGLEYRAHRRGWETLLWRRPGATEGCVDTPPGVAPSSHPVGPRPDFPFRSSVVAPERPPGVLRIWIASASHAEDVYLPVQQIFPTRLEADLNAGGVRCQVLNASRARNMIDRNVHEVGTEGPRWRPDVAVLYQMSNDVDHLSNRYLASSPATGQRGPSPAKAEPPATEHAVARLAERTSLYTLMKANVTPLVAGMRVLRDDLGADAEREFVQRIVDFVRTARSVGATPVLCTFATSHSRDDLSALPFETRQFMLRYNLYLSPQGWMDTIQRLNSRIEQVAREEHVPLVDVAGKMTGHREFFRDFVHFTPAGHERVGRLLADRLRTLPPRIAMQRENRRATP